MLGVLIMEKMKEINEILSFLNENTRFLENKKFIQHGNTTIYDHVISVAHMSLTIVDSLNIKVNRESLIRGALLHDYFLYDWHDKELKNSIHGFTHAKCAYENAKKELNLNKIEKDIILKHMFPLNICPPIYRESWIVTIADKIVSTRETISYRLPAKEQVME